MFWVNFFKCTSNKICNLLFYYYQYLFKYVYNYIFLTLYRAYICHRKRWKNPLARCPARGYIYYDNPGIMVINPKYEHNHRRNEFEEPLANFSKDMKNYSKLGIGTCKTVFQRVLALGYVELFITSIIIYNN